MNLLEQHARIMKRSNFKSDSGTVDRIVEIYEKSERNESGYIPIIIKPEVEEKKKKKL